jgi:hypothetical protein
MCFWQNTQRNLRINYVQVISIWPGTFDICITEQFHRFHCYATVAQEEPVFDIMLKVVTNEKGEAVGDVLTIICYSWGGGAGCFFCHFNGLPSCMNSYLSFR